MPRQGIGDELAFDERQVGELRMGPSGKRDHVADADSHGSPVSSVFGSTST